MANKSAVTNADKPKSQPSFEKGTVVTESSLVVDEHGQAWWVNPSNRTIEPAKS